jgi:hypothetical protein
MKSRKYFCRLFTTSLGDPATKSGDGFALNDAQITVFVIIYVECHCVSLCVQYGGIIPKNGYVYPAFTLGRYNLFIRKPKKGIQIWNDSKPIFF